MVLEPTRPATEEDLDLAVEIVRNRVDGLGVVEPEISTQGGNILVQLPGVDDQQRAIDLVGQTAELRFRPVLEAISEQAYQAEVAANDTGTPTDIETRFALVADAAANEATVLAQYDDERNVVSRHRLGPTGVTGDGLESAESRFDGLTGWFVAPVFRAGPAGIDLFQRAERAMLLAGRDLPHSAGGHRDRQRGGERSGNPIRRSRLLPLRAVQHHHHRRLHPVRGRGPGPGARLRGPARRAGGPAEPHRVGLAGNRRPRRRGGGRDHRSYRGVAVSDLLLPPAGADRHHEPGHLRGDAVDHHLLAGRVEGLGPDPGRG